MSKLALSVEGVIDLGALIEAFPGQDAGGFFENALIAISADGKQIVLAHNRVVAVCRLRGAKAQRARGRFLVKIPNAVNEGDRVTAVSVVSVPWSGAGAEVACIIVGTAHGAIRIFSTDCQLLLSQLVHPSPVTRLRFRAPIDNGFWVRSELNVVHTDGVVARIEAELLYTELHARLVLLQTASTSALLSHHIAILLPSTKWLLNHSGGLLDAWACAIEPDAMRIGVEDRYRVGAPGPGLGMGMGLPLGPDPQPRRKLQLAVIAVGDPVVALYFAPEHQRRSLGPATLAKGVAKGLSIASAVAKSVWFGRASASASTAPLSLPSSEGADSGVSACGERTVDTVPPIVVHPYAALRDPPRRGQWVTGDELAGLVVCADNLARVLVIDLTRFIIVRILKGYRDAVCLLFRAPSPPPDPVPGPVNPSAVTSCGALFLAIHAPHRHLVEVWQMPRGGRVRVVAAPKGTRLIADVGGLLGGASDRCGTGRHSRQRRGCFIVFPDGTVHHVTAGPPPPPPPLPQGG